MILNIGAAFWPDADEVVIDSFATQDDGVTPVVPDTLQLNLLLQTIDLNGTQTLRPLQTMTIPSSYAQADMHIHARFRAPQRRQDLWLTEIATFGATQVTKTIQVGISNTERITMDLPDNEIFTQDVLDLIPTGGPGDQIMPDNPIILSPDILSYNETFIFSAPQPPETYADLSYVGGGVDRLLLNSQTNSYQVQKNVAPWLLPAYLFLENGQQNLLTNSYFITQTANIPQTWSFDGAGSAVTYTLGFDHSTSSDAQVWAVRFRQNNILLNSFSQTSLICAQQIPVTGGNPYCFSAYLRTRLMTGDADVKNILIRIQWLDGTAPISATEQSLLVQDFSALGLAACSGVAPIGATAAQVYIFFYDVDAGDDIECSLFAPQFEAGLLPSTRILTVRTQDVVGTQPYDASNQKIRFQFIPGFGSAGLLAPIALTSGPLGITFDSSGVTATLAGGTTLSAPVLFSAGDFVDLTISHLSNGKFTIYSGGNVVAQQTIGVVAPTATPVLIQGIGIELLQLNVFSRS